MHRHDIGDFFLAQHAQKLQVRKSPGNVKMRDIELVSDFSKLPKTLPTNQPLGQA